MEEITDIIETPLSNDMYNGCSSITTITTTTTSNTTTTKESDKHKQKYSNTTEIGEYYEESKENIRLTNNSKDICNSCMKNSQNISITKNVHSSKIEYSLEENIDAMIPVVKTPQIMASSSVNISNDTMKNSENISNGCMKDSEDISNGCVKDSENDKAICNVLTFSSNNKSKPEKGGFQFCTKAEVHMSDDNPQIKQCEESDFFDVKNCTDMDHKAQCEMERTDGLGSDYENLNGDRTESSSVTSEQLNNGSEVKVGVESTVAGGSITSENNVDTIVSNGNTFSETSREHNGVDDGDVPSKTETTFGVTEGNGSLEIGNVRVDANRSMVPTVTVGTVSCSNITSELKNDDTNASRNIGLKIDEDGTNNDNNNNTAPEVDSGIGRNNSAEISRMNIAATDGGLKNIPSEVAKDDSISSENTASKEEIITSGDGSTETGREVTTGDAYGGIQEGIDGSVTNGNIAPKDFQETLSDENILPTSSTNNEESNIFQKTEEPNIIEAENPSSKCETVVNSVDNNLEINDDNSSMIEYSLEANTDAVIPVVKTPQIMAPSSEQQNSAISSILTTLEMANNYQTDNFTVEMMETGCTDNKNEERTDKSLTALRPIIHTYVVNETGVREKRTNSIEIKTVTFSQDTIFNEDKSKQYRKEKISFRTVYKSCTTDSEGFSKINPLFEDDAEPGNSAMSCSGLVERSNSLVYLGDDENSLSGDSENDPAVKISVLNFPSYMEKYLQKDDSSVIISSSKVQDYSTHSNMTTITNTWNKGTLMEPNIMPCKPEDFIVSMPPLDIAGYRIYVKKKQKQERYHFIMKIAFIILFLLTIVTIVMIILYFEVIKR